jgi:hypothetical protein
MSNHSNWIKIDLDAPIIPGAAAAGLQIGDDIRKILAFAKPDEAHELVGFTIHRFGPVKVWSSSNAVSQIGVYEGYHGALNNHIRIGSTIAHVQEFFGREVKEDDDDNLVLVDYPGLCFETEEWHENHSVQQNLSRRITEIYVYKGSKASLHQLAE